MPSNRLAAAALALLAGGCGGGPATVTPDPPPDDAKQREIALKNFSSEDPVQRMIAVRTIALSPAAKEHLGDLKKLEKDPDANVRAAVKESIQKIEGK